MMTETETKWFSFYYIPLLNKDFKYYDFKVYIAEAKY